MMMILCIIVALFIIRLHIFNKKINKLTLHHFDCEPLYIALLAPDSITDTQPFVPEVVEYLCRVGGGFLVVDRALSIAFAGNSISRNINGCCNAIWFFRLGYYMESFNFSRIIIQPTHLNVCETGLRGDRISN